MNFITDPVGQAAPQQRKRCTQQDSSLLALEDWQVKPRVTYMPYFMAPRTVEPTNHYDDNDLKRFKAVYVTLQEVKKHRVEWYFNED
ncbi:unnamed protein product [Gadus morhua 'NCC']